MGKEFNPQRIFSEHQHCRRIIAVCTNMATVTSCENYRYITLETRRKLEPNYVPYLSLGSFLGTRRSATVPEVFVKVTSAQLLSHF